MNLKPKKELFIVSNRKEYVEGEVVEDSNTSKLSQVNPQTVRKAPLHIAPRTIQIENVVISSKSKCNRTKLDKKWKDEVSKYRDRVFYCYRGENIRLALETLGFDYMGVAPRDLVSILHAIIGAFRLASKDLGKTYISFPAVSIWAFTSPYVSTIYSTHGRVREYQGQTIVKALDVLIEQEIIFYKRYDDGRIYSKDRCRRICINERFVMAYEQVITQSFFDLLFNIEVPDDYHMKSQVRGENFNSKTSSITRSVVKKLQRCQFRFNTEALDTEILANLPGIENNPAYVESIIYALAGMNIRTDEPQYHPSYHRQDSGRLHTIGGAISMSKELRKLFIKPIEPTNLMVDVDLASAQLFMLCKILDLPELDLTIRKLLSASPNNSLWPYIAPQSEMPKSAKKTILYAFCFGGDYTSLPYIVNTKLASKGVKYKINSADVDAVLNNSLLSPLVKARDEFINNYSLDRILSNKVEKLATNDLGNVFRVYEEAQNYEGSNSLKIGARLLAFLAQGAEQNIIQPIINSLDYNILAFQYDGFTLECGDNLEFIHMIDRVNSLCNYPLSYEIL